MKTTKNNMTTEQPKQFPRGFSNWQETHFDIVQYITNSMRDDDEDTLFDAAINKSLFTMTEEENGHGGLYQLAEQLTEYFEEAYKDVVFNGDTVHYFDHLSLFMDAIKQLESKEQLPKFLADLKSATSELKSLFINDQEAK